MKKSMAGAGVLLGTLILTLSQSGLAQQGDEVVQKTSKLGDLQFSFGLKLHTNKVTATALLPVDTTSGSVDILDNFRSSTENTLIPAFSLRYGNFFASASHFLETDYEFQAAAAGVRLKLNRRETDVNLGYYVLPGLGISVGYKQLKVNTLQDLKYEGPSIGLSGYGSIGGGWGLYGNIAYGKLQLKPSFVENDKKNTYVTQELGIAYSFDFRDTARLVKSLTLTLGYRNQTIESEKPVSVAQVSVVNGAPTVVGTSSAHLENVSRGPVLGLVISF